MDSFENANNCLSIIMKEFVEHISNGIIPSLEQNQWNYEKKKIKVCKADDNGKKKRRAVGEKYYSQVLLNSREVNTIWKIFRKSTSTLNFNKIERIRSNEKDLKRYDFRAENTITGDMLYCLIHLQGEWNNPHILIRLFVGPRYTINDLSNK